MVSSSSWDLVSASAREATPSILIRNAFELFTGASGDNKCGSTRTRPVFRAVKVEDASVASISLPFVEIVPDRKSVANATRIKGSEDPGDALIGSAKEIVEEDGAFQVGSVGDEPVGCSTDGALRGRVSLRDGCWAETNR